MLSHYSDDYVLASMAPFFSVTVCLFGMVGEHELSLFIYCLFVLEWMACFNLPFVHSYKLVRLLSM